MSLKEQVYSVLIVSASENLNAALEKLLPESQYDPVHTVSSISAAKRAFAEKAYDFILINSPLPDDIGTRFAIDVCNSKGTVVLLMIPKEVFSSINWRNIIYPAVVFMVGLPEVITGLMFKRIEEE